LMRSPSIAWAGAAITPICAPGQGRRGLLETAVERVEYQLFDEADAWRASDMEAYRQNPGADRRQSFFLRLAAPGTNRR
jgi:hypothetical protein